jgi:hypothetical protein
MKWTKDWDDKFLKLWNEGATDRAISEQLGITISSSIMRRRHHGLKPNMTRGVMTEERTELLVGMHKQGKTDGAIAKELGLSTSKVQHERNRLGLKPNIWSRRTSKDVSQSKESHFITRPVERQYTDDNGVLVTVYAKGWAIGSTKGVV